MPFRQTANSSLLGPSDLRSGQSDSRSGLLLVCRGIVTCVVIAVDQSFTTYTASYIVVSRKRVRLSAHHPKES